MANSYSFGIVDDWKAYTDYLAVDGPGEAAVVPSPEGDGWAIIFTDRHAAGGVATAVGQDNDWANALAHYWVKNAKAGEDPGNVFDTIAWRYGVTHISNYERLADLEKATGFNHTGWK